MIDTGFNMPGMGPLGIDFQIQNVGKNSSAAGFPRKKIAPKEAIGHFHSIP